MPWRAGSGLEGSRPLLAQHREVSHGLSATRPAGPPSGFSRPRLTPEPGKGGPEGALGPQGSGRSQAAALSSWWGHRGHMRELTRARGPGASRAGRADGAQARVLKGGRAARGGAGAWGVPAVPP
ncbi:unnamed protein product [Rangifer tarandus platyrhynchus]|uniref:Uncharacterized protein n=2 Tax=Rangifer tarandus platyrhynchus TaxID=3082113 RepID=A0AC59ZSK1_RANTA|nr:unnamed protein product [Rangifer tarandus platyrhynchus]